MTADFRKETIKTKEHQNFVWEKNGQYIILYPEKMFFIVKAEINVFPEKPIFYLWPFPPILLKIFWKLITTDHKQDECLFWSKNIKLLFTGFEITNALAFILEVSSWNGARGYMPVLNLLSSSLCLVQH